MLGAGDVPLQALEDQHALVVGAGLEDLAVLGLGAAGQGVADVAVLGETIQSRPYRDAAPASWEKVYFASWL